MSTTQGGSIVKVETKIVELPTEQELLKEILADSDHDVKNISLSTVVHEGRLKHFALVVWSDKGKAEHWYLGGPSS